jgi:ribosomal protein S16
MTKLVVKLRIAGKKNQRFTKLVVTEQDSTARGPFKCKLGFWDTRKQYNHLPRNVVFNIRKFSYYYMYGMTIHKNSLKYIYYYFLARGTFSPSYFDSLQIKFYIEREINKKKFW